MPHKPTLTLYLAPCCLHAADRGASATAATPASATMQTWYVLSDGTGAPPIVFGKGRPEGMEPAQSAFPSALPTLQECDAERSPARSGQAFAVAREQPLLCRTVRLSMKQFHLIRRFAEDFGALPG